ncbi:DUF6754 domain-containing protein [Caulifigura coniformis]|nr:DUF6754 domain-containing protein [Caulifigura coniformis]
MASTESPSICVAMETRSALSLITRSGFAGRLVMGLCLLLLAATADAAPPAPPRFVSITDKPFDNGHALVVVLDVDPEPAATTCILERSFERKGLYGEPQTLERPTPAEPIQTSELPSNAEVVKLVTHIETEVGDLPTDKPVWFRAYAVNAAGEKSAFVYSDQPTVATEQFFDGNRFWFFVVTVFVCGSVIAMILVARTGAPMWIRKISALDAIDEAVGRATEMGKSCLFVAGVQDLNEIETIAGVTVLSRVAEKAAEYDATVVVPTSRSLVMTAARETSQAAYLAAGRPDAYQEDRIYYVTDDQFGFVAHLSGYMMREKPAACFYMGQFYAESLLLGETGNTIGAIQIAGTAQPAQLPFFVAACDYTLIGEEFFAASAYLSRDPDQLGSLKGQDIGKLLVMSIIVIGVSLLTIVNLAPSGTAVHDLASAAADYLQNHMLTSS